MRYIQRAWATTKHTLEYLHLAEFVLHASRSDVLSFLVLAVTHSKEWVLLSMIGTAVLYLMKRRPHVKVFSVHGKDHEGAREEHLALQKAAASDGGIVPSCLPQTLADLARQGVRVKVIIELHPPSRG